MRIVCATVHSRRVAMLCRPPKPPPSLRATGRANGVRMPGVGAADEVDEHLDRHVQPGPAGEQATLRRAAEIMNRLADA